MRSNKKPSLLFISGPLVGKMVLLEDGTTLLGKSQVANIVIKDNGVSRKHMQITVEGDRVTLEDLRSVNGTFVNGERVRSKVLKDGDKVQVCRGTVIKFAYCDQHFTDLLREKMERLEKLESSDEMRTKSYSEKIIDLIEGGESKTVEFKSTLRKSIENKDVPESVIENNTLKTIAAFLNTEGGFLLVGVSDSGDIIGMEHDAFKSNDDILKHVRNLINRDFGPEFYEYINYKLVNVNDKKVLFFECKQSPMPTFLGKNEVFYVRTNPATDQLTGKALITYIKNHFPPTHHL